MPNLIALAETYVPLLDEVYKLGALSSVLDANEKLVRMGQNGKDILVATIVTQGLADNVRGDDYVDGTIVFDWETKTPSWDRNRMFSVSALDDIETAGMAFGMTASEFIRTRVIPEIDAVRFATYAGTDGITVATPATLADGSAVLTALQACQNSMDENEVPTEGRILLITPTHLNNIQALDTTKSKQVLASFSKIVKIPQTRFYTAITLKDGVTIGEEDGGYVKLAPVYALTTDTDIVAGKKYYTVAESVYTLVESPIVGNIATYYEITAQGKDINFMCIHPSAVIQTLKHVRPKIIPADVNQNGDNHKFGYHAYGINETFDNKLKGIYLHNVA